MVWMCEDNRIDSGFCGVYGLGRVGVSFGMIMGEGIELGQRGGYDQILGEVQVYGSERLWLVEGW